MRIDILTLFPDMFKNVLNESMLKIARRKKKISVNVHNLRQWTYDRHRTADDKPYGGGSGMLIKVEPIYKALAGLLGENKVKRIKKNQKSKDTKIILLTPRGKLFNQKMAKSFTKSKNIVFICGHYEGVDERVKHLITDDVSIGDYILTGGEIPAMVVLDAITRLIPGVLGDSSSLEHESFEDNLLEYPQYTRPREFEGMMVPEVLLSGNHKKIEKWRKKQSLKKTKEVRSDLCTR